jgi:hypothetical protein
LRSRPIPSRKQSTKRKPTAKTPGEAVVYEETLPTEVWVEEDIGEPQAAVELKTADDLFKIERKDIQVLARREMIDTTEEDMKDRALQYSTKRLRRVVAQINKLKKGWSGYK